MFALYICIIASFQLLTSASKCLNDQHCTNCTDAGQCSTPCDKGFYGTNCNIECSAACLNGKCVAGDNGAEKCTQGCKPGYFGSRCEVPCRKPSANETCQKCPVECNDGFCDLGTRCVSGCVDNYYGFNCSCGSTGGCHPGCGENCSETSSVTVYYYWAAGGAGVLVLVSILGLVIYLSCRMKSVDAILSHRVGWKRENRFETSEPQVSLSTPCTDTLPHTLYSAVMKERQREVIPIGARSEMADLIDAYDAVTTFDDEVGTYNRLKWNA